EYAAHRASAFALALDGDAEAALAELDRGWTDEWPFPADFAVDVARVRFLAGEYREALVALQLAVRGRERVDESASELAGECVREGSARRHRRAVERQLLPPDPVEGGGRIRA